MNIAIVDPYISGRYLAQTLSEHQINSIAILTNTSVAEKMQLSGRLNPASFTHLVYLENYKQDDLIRHLVSLDIDMLIAGTEYVIEEAETLSTQLGLKYGNPLITLPLRKNKSSILKHLGAENIGMPASEYINLHDEKIAQTVQRIAVIPPFLGL